jgi:hypothetical protein
MTPPAMLAYRNGAPVLARVECASCQAALELECEPLAGFYGYRTHNEFFCPACGKQNHARTTGAIVAVRAVASR